MLASLADDITEHGGQPISVEPLPQAVPAVHVEPVPRDEPATAPGVPSAGLAAEQISGWSGAPSADAMPSVHVAPIPDAVPDSLSRDTETSGDDVSSREAAKDNGAGRAADGGQQATPPAALSADDTSTAALRIVDAKSP
jgi:hypothetical protein